MSKQTTFKIKGMTCNMCVKHVTKALQEVEGVSDVKVRLEDGNATVTYDPQKADKQTLKAAVDEAGYEAVV
jgi:Cu+-exporting ATPase